MIKFNILIFAIITWASSSENSNQLNANDAEQDLDSPVTPSWKISYELDPYLEEICWYPVYQLEGYFPNCIDYYRGTSVIAEAISLKEDSLFVIWDTSNKYEYITPIINSTLLSLLTRDSYRLNRKDLYLAVFCLVHIPVNINLDELINIVSVISNVIDVPVFNEDQNLIFLKIFAKHLSDLDKISTRFQIVKSNLMLAVWHPFERNYLGWSWFKNKENESFIQPISDNWSVDSSETDKYSLNAYVPKYFLESIVLDVPVHQKEDLYIVMMMSDSDFLSRKFLPYNLKGPQNTSQIAGVSIPGFCKQNNFPMVFDHANGNNFTWEYIDDYGRPLPKCALSQMSYFSRSVENASVEYFQSVVQENCLGGIYKDIFWRETPVGSIVYPETFCVNEELEIPQLRCANDAKFTLGDVSDFACSKKHKMSDFSEIIYGYATNCWAYPFSEILRTYDSANITFIDTKLLYDIFKCIEEGKLLDDKQYFDLNFEALFYGIEKGLEFLDKLPRLYTKANILKTFMVYFFTKLNRIPINFSKNYKTFTYQKFLLSSTIRRLVICKRESDSFLNYIVKQLPHGTNAMNYISDDKVEVIIEVNSSIYIDPYEIPCFSVIVVYNNMFPTEDNYVSKSRTVIVVTTSSTVIQLQIYLRVIDDNENWRMNYYTGEGYIFNIGGSGAIITYLHENKSDYCDTGRYLWKGIFGKLDNVPNDIKISSTNEIDILSIISMSVNNAEGKKGIENIYNKYSVALKILRLSGTILSFIGIVVILLSATIIKGWRQPRFYTIQLSISFALEILFFIADNFISELPQVGFYIFYYCILSQFSWMFLVGHMQYIKYIQIFRFGKIGMIKSLMIGWLMPVALIVVALLAYKDCLKCNLCYKNKEIFLYFVFTPIGSVIICNSIIYVMAMFNIWKSKAIKSCLKYKSRSVILLPFVMGITWSFIIMLICPWAWLYITGLFLMHIVVPSQGFVLFIFVVLLDKQTRLQWKNCLIPRRLGVYV